MCYFTRKIVKGSGKDSSEEEMTVCIPNACEDCKCKEKITIRDNYGSDQISVQKFQRKREVPMSGSFISTKQEQTKAQSQPTASLDIQEMSYTPVRNENNLLTKRKWESSGQSSAFNEVLKKQKVAYEQGAHGPNVHDVVFRPIPMHNPFFMEHIQFTRPQERVAFNPVVPRFDYAAKEQKQVRNVEPPKDTVKEIFQKEHQFLQNMHQEAQKGIYSLHSMISRSNSLISELLNRQDKLEQKIDKLSRQNQELKTELEGRVEAKKRTSSINAAPAPLPTGKTFISNTQELMEALYHRGRIQDFAYFLNVETALQLPIYRERNFGQDRSDSRFKLKMVDATGKVVENSNLIMLSVSLYTTSNPPHKLEMNTGGFNILKQGADYELLDGYCSLEKLQIREVTSHYPNGWLFMVVEARPQSGVISKGSGAPAHYIDPSLIQPYILARLVVKAKRMK